MLPVDHLHISHNAPWKEAQYTAAYFGFGSLQLSQGAYVLASIQSASKDMCTIFATDTELGIGGKRCMLAPTHSSNV